MLFDGTCLWKRLCLARFFFALSVWTAKKANATAIVEKENRYTIYFRPGVNKPLVFADTAGPNEKGTLGGRIYCLADLLSERIAGFAHCESRKNSQIADRRVRLKF